MPRTAIAVYDWLTREECLTKIQCSPSAFQRMVVAGHVRDRKAGGRRRYWREDVERIAAPPKPAA